MNERAREMLIQRRIEKVIGEIVKIEFSPSGHVARQDRLRDELVDAVMEVLRAELREQR